MNIMDTNEIKNSVIAAYDDIAEAYWEAYQEADEADWKYWEKFVVACKNKKVLESKTQNLIQINDCPLRGVA